MPTSIAAWFTSRGTAALPGYFISDTPWAGHKVTDAGTWARDQASVRLSGGTLYNSTVAQNDARSTDHYFSSGTYKIASIHFTNTDQAIATFNFDGVSQGTIDHYGGAASQNVYAEITGLTVTAGVKVVQEKAATKNASSSGYQLSTFTHAFVRTGA